MTSTTIATTDSTTDSKLRAAWWTASVLAGALALGSCASGRRGDTHAGESAPALPPGTRCVDFDHQAPGATFPVGGSFTDNGVKLAVQRFQWETSAWATIGKASIETAKQGGGNVLRCDNVNVSFAFGAASGLDLKFVERGGNLNLTVNRDFRNVANLSDLNGATVGGASVTVTGGSGDGIGTLSLRGAIDSFAIGGQGLWIDDVCAAAP
jgi:hypothetical protein